MLETALNPLAAANKQFDSVGLEQIDISFGFDFGMDAIQPDLQNNRLDFFPERISPRSNMSSESSVVSIISFALICILVLYCD